jgi:hypothetical protein
VLKTGTYDREAGAGVPPGSQKWNPEVRSGVSEAGSGNSEAGS